MVKWKDISRIRTNEDNHMMVHRATLVLLTSVVFLSIGCKSRSSGSSAKDSVGEAHSVFAKADVPSQCKASYRQGFEAVQDLIKTNAPSLDALDPKLALITDDACRDAFSSGAFDATHLAQQSVMLEYLLERKVSHDTPEFANDNRDWGVWQNAIRKLYQQRISLLFGDPESISILETDQFAGVADHFVDSVRLIAKQQGKPVSIGRFIITAEQYLMPFTAFEYVLNAAGEIDQDSHRQVNVRPGSYQHAIESLGHRLEDTLNQYFQWRPSIFFGEDSFWRGSFWRAVGWSDTPKSVREIKQDGFDTEMRMHLSFARALQLNMKPYNDVYSLFLKREKDVLNSEIEAYKRTTVALCAAPLVPIGMAVGAAGLASAGLSALPAGTASFTYVGGSLAYAANTSALISLGTIGTFTGISGFNVVRSVMRGDGSITVADAADQIVGAGLASFPLAAALPVVVGQGAAGVKSAIVTAKALIATGGKLTVALKTMSWQAIGHELPKMPLEFVKWWAQAWWKNKILIVNQVADTVVSVGVEIVSREAIGGKSAFFLHDEHGKTWVNPDAMVTLTSGILMSAGGRPITTMPSIGGRMIAYRAFSLSVNMVSQLINTGKIDERRLVLDELYGAIVMSPISEVNRAVTFSTFMGKQNPATQFVLLAMWRMAIKTPTSTIKTLFINRYVKDRQSPLTDLGNMTKAAFNVDLTGLEDDEIRESLDTALKDPELRAILDVK